MTECERIIQQGILPKRFFEEEVRCDYLITKERKKIWAIAIDSLLELDRICKKYEIKYYLLAGTLLGAVRHKGFIPWDDDIDIGMMRKDYERFIKIASKDFKSPYFLQTPYSDQGYFFSFAKVRNENTTGISNSFRYESFNQGLYIDIFQIDNCTKKDVKQNFDKINQLILENSNYMRRKSPDQKDIERYSNWSGRDPFSVFEEIQSIASSHQNENTEFVNMSTCTVYPYDKLMWNKSDFSDSIYLDFEGFKFPCPKGYHNILKIMYGDYMIFPPIEKRGEWHNTVIFNPDIPYKEYLKEILKK